ncbi:MAG: hypothetical protein JKY54_19630 [Flavobacteriales bacterium]|nr:hypothetical protein [Flavobacteriales bacterium]
MKANTVYFPSAYQIPTCSSGEMDLKKKKSGKKKCCKKYMRKGTPCKSCPLNHA